MNKLIILPLADIDFDNRYFKISRNKIDKKLIISLSRFGVLEPPVLLNKHGNLSIVTGFNKLSILRDQGQESVKATVVDKIECDYFINHGLNKSHRNEIGPIGKIRFLTLLKEYFNCPPDHLLLIGTTGLNLSNEVVNDAVIRDKLSGLPDDLKNYLDEKDINLRTLNDLNRLPSEAVQLVNRWVAEGAIRVNLFKKIIDMATDVIKRDGRTDALLEIFAADNNGNSRYDESLHDSLYRVRYPEYSKKRDEAMLLINDISGDRLKIEIPDYFEGGDISLIIKINRNDDLSKLNKKINDVFVNANMVKLLNIL